VAADTCVRAQAMAKDGSLASPAKDMNRNDMLELEGTFEADIAAGSPSHSRGHHTLPAIPGETGACQLCSLRTPDMPIQVGPVCIMCSPRTPDIPLESGPRRIMGSLRMLDKIAKVSEAASIRDIHVMHPPEPVWTACVGGGREVCATRYGATAKFEAPLAQQFHDPPVLAGFAQEGSDMSVADSIRVLTKAQFLEEEALREMEEALSLLPDRSVTLWREAPLTVEREVTCNTRSGASWTVPLATSEYWVAQTGATARATNASPEHTWSMHESTIELVDLAVHWDGLPKKAQPEHNVYVDYTEVKTMDVECFCGAC